MKARFKSESKEREIHKPIAMHWFTVGKQWGVENISLTMIDPPILQIRAEKQTVQDSAIKMPS